MQVGEVIIWKRTFTKEEVLLFGQLSGDEGIHHVKQDKHGRLMVQGLLTATLPTKIGGDLNFIAQQMAFDFTRPVYSGDTILCEVTLTSIDQIEDQTNLSAQWVCRNQKGEEVLTGHARGVILAPDRGKRS